MQKSERRDSCGRTEEEFLRQYKAGDYPRPALTVDMVIFEIAQDGLRVLLIRRKNHPWIGCRALPGGFVEPGESAEQAAARELEEETHLKNMRFAPCGFYSAPGRDPRTWIVSRGFFAVNDSGQKAFGGDDAADADWFLIRDESRDSHFCLLLSHKDEELRIEGECSVHPLTGLIRVSGAICEDLACDHASIISDAYLALQRCGGLR